MRKTYLRIVVFSFLFSLAYAIVRYNVLGPVPWKDVPFYVLNKGISLTAFIVLSLSFSLKPLKKIGVNVSDNLYEIRNALGMSGFLLSLVHVLISFMILNPIMFKKFYLENETLTFFAGISMLGGVLSFVILWCYNLSLQGRFKQNKVFSELISSKRFILLTLFFVGIHLFFMGYEGWLNRDDWYGGLPPISLISFIFFSLAFVINVIGRK